MKILFILDPLERLDLHYDSSLYLIKEFHQRGQIPWIVEINQIFATEKSVFGYVSQMKPGKSQNFIQGSDPLRPNNPFEKMASQVRDLTWFDVILIRKEPPFDLQYLYLTHLLDRIKRKVLISNDPAGIRDTNEKLGCLMFPELCPRSLVTCQVNPLIQFSNQIKKDLVLKPLNERAGHGVTLAPFGSKKMREIILKATKNEKEVILAQEFIGKRPYKDKRVTLLEGKVLFVYEKRAAPGEFRANLSCGGSAHPASIDRQDQKIIQTIRPYLKKAGLHLVGLDILEGQLIDLNVTCPSGFTDARILSPQLETIGAWADFLEKSASAKKI